MLSEGMTRKGKLADRLPRLSLLLALHSIELITWEPANLFSHQLKLTIYPTVK
ncbi:hypothetical protein HMPREF0973_03097 [Prevotella veroralis F0319]|uniref:Uncharacterized protein n=1 Tax=Prevotella veroralis F0319 TaxID=649761 RepID=C9MTW9_9BACT|nr:hypothetical protein HMPREF0973_03097 [Prevotella veroralis F0319]